jgi:hypothetical protein
MRIFAVLFAILLTAGCAASRNAHYAAQSEYRNAIAAQNAAKLAAVQSNAAACSDDTCRVAVAAFAALVQSERVERPVQYQSQATSVLGLVERALSVGAAVYGQKIQGDSLVDLAGVVASSAGDRSTHSFIDQSDHSDHSTSIADSFNSEAGDTISDSGNVSDSGNGNAGRDLIGGNRTDNAGNIGTDNRIDSPGPIDSSNPGDCDGESNCNPTTEQPEG